MSELQPTVETTLVDYFRQRIEEAGEGSASSPHEDTVWYMSTLLARFGESEALFSYDRGEVSIRPLALLYKDALETDTQWERLLILRQLGDLALFLGALFPENYARKGIAKDYFVGMGGGAYSYLSENARQNRHIYSELAGAFTRMLELVARVCSRQNVFDSFDILNLYKRWRQSGDPQLAAQLRALGVSVQESTSLH